VHNGKVDILLLYLHVCVIIFPVLVRISCVVPLTSHNRDNVHNVHLQSARKIHDYPYERLIFRILLQVISG